MTLKGIPDLRGEWWWGDHTGYKDHRSAKPEMFDWTKELGGWDMMNLLVEAEDARTIWVEVLPESYCFN
jgi:hypothetical protein